MVGGGDPTRRDADGLGGFMRSAWRHFIYRVAIIAIAAGFAVALLMRSTAPGLAPCPAGVDDPDSGGRHPALPFHHCVRARRGLAGFAGITGGPIPGLRA
jgi:hypothetical protein